MAKRWLVVQNLKLVKSSIFVPQTFLAESFKGSVRKKGKGSARVYISKIQKKKRVTLLSLNSTLLYKQTQAFAVDTTTASSGAVK